MQYREIKLQAIPTKTTPKERVSRRHARVQRTQEERSAATREKLLDAAIECLIERGYAGTTTTEIADRAGVSRGAQLHHFPSKVGLLINAMQHLAGRRIADLRREAQSIRGTKDRIKLGTDLLWSSFSGSLYMAAVELWIAARTDRELHDALCPVEKALGETIEVLQRELYGEYSSHPNFKTIMRLTTYMMRGMALERILGAPEKRRSELIASWESLMASAFGPNPSGTKTA
jgi:AcrR family transcriptional regulator